MGVCSERVAAARGCARLSQLYLQGDKMAGRRPAILLYRNIYLRDDLRDRNTMDICESHITSVVAIG